jgi:eukaryotic-like serine/threonine-protein kinase
MYEPRFIWEQITIVGSQRFITSAVSNSNMSTVRSKFREAALISGLVTDDQFAATVATIAKSNGGKIVDDKQISDKEIATRMVAMKFLTAYQADQLMSGRTKLKLGPYVITDWIGQGGMGQVFKAVHEMLGRECAVKVLPINKTTPDAIENFRREIRAQAKLDHHHLVRAYDAGEDGNVHYLVVEYVPGTDLRRLVRNHGRLALNQAASIIRQSAMGLAHAHDRHLIHRDIKPGNILVTPDGVAKLSDLGLAFCLSDADDPRMGKIVGTADYLSPEQIKAPLEVTEASDIYSLGCTLYYAVTGKVPFPGGTTKSKARRHLEETPWHPRRFNEEVSDEFVDLIGDMMEKNPAERIQSAREVVDRLAPWAKVEGVAILQDDSRRRWMAAPVPGDQDTDPNDIADLALSEMSGNQETQQSHSGTNPIDNGKSKPPPPGGIVESFARVGHLRNEPLMFSLNGLLIAAVVCGALGALIGFMLGYIAKG